MNEVKSFSGILNTDDSEFVIAPNHHKDARNGIFRGTPGNMRFEGVRGTTLVPNALLPTSGNNETIGAYFDQIKKRVFIYSYNSEDNHGIYQYDIATKTFSIIIQCFTNTTDDILNFTLDRLIVSSKIVYGDITLGDLLCFVDCQKRPTKVNIQRALTGGYGTFIERSFIDVCREPSIAPPYCAYENDATVTLNNLRGKLFKFKIRYFYDDKDTSVTSSHSEIPLPPNEQNPDTQSDETKNAVIKLCIQTGKSNVYKIEILGAQSLGNVFGDFFSIATLDKAALSIPNDDIYLYSFFNDKSYTAIDIQQSIQLFDYVPLKANDNELLNGNTLIYGGITEGFDLITPNVTLSPEETPVPYGNSNIIVSQSGNSGFGTGNIHIALIGTASTGNVYNVVTTNYTNTVTAATDVNADVITLLIAEFTANGFTIVSNTSSELVVTKTGESLLLWNLVKAGLFFTVLADSYAAYDDSNKEVYGLVYFDEKGRSNGVITSDAFVTQTIPYQSYDYDAGNTTTKIVASIFHRPPLWATYYQWVRSANSTKSNYLYWATDGVFSDSKYVYFSIASLNQYIVDNPSTGTQLAYDFADGDRIKILQERPSGTLLGQDYVILNSLTNPVINGSVRSGQVIQIAKPTYTFTAQLYVVEIYTPTKNFATTELPFFEFGERYAIGNPGTNTAFHQGYEQNQSTDLATPAVTTFYRGDGYIRGRSMNVGNVLQYDILINDGDAGIGTNTTLKQSLTNTPYNNPDYIFATTVANGAYVVPPPSNWTISQIAGSQTFDVTGTINCIAFNGTSVGFEFDIKITDGTSTTTVVLGSTGPASAGQGFVFPVNTSITIPAGWKSYLLLVTSDTTAQIKLLPGNIKYVESNKVVDAKVYSPYFSDFYPSAVNSNGRAFVTQPYAAEQYYPTLTRWGGSYQIDTDINLISRFYPENLDQIDSQFGDIQRLMLEGRLLYIYQNRKVGRYGVYAKFIKDNSGNNQLVTTDQIITTNNVDYLVGDFGIGTLYASLTRGSNAHYFTDPVRGYHIRRSSNGLQPISEIYKGQYYISSLISPYDVPVLKQNGSPANVLGYYDFLEEQFGTVFQAGTNAMGDVVADYNLTFSEPRNAYSSFFDFFPEFITCVQKTLYSWVAGEMYTHDNTVDYCNFYGTQFNPSIQLVFNNQVALREVFNTVKYISNKIWVSDTAGDIYTSEVNDQTNLPQISKLLGTDYTTRGNFKDAALLKDINSNLNPNLGLREGDGLVGVYIVIKFIYKGSEFSYIYIPSILTQEDKENFKKP